MTPAPIQVDPAAQALRVDQARYWALCEQPFYGALLARLACAPGKVKTFATDGKRVLYSPEFAATLTDEELRFVLLHEALHPAHAHLWRLPADKLGNAAGDHEINLTLAGVEGISMPKGGLADPRFTGMACEEIYKALRDEADEQQDQDEGGDDQQQGGQGGAGEAGEGEGEPNPCGEFSEPATDAQGGDQGAQAAQAEQLRQEWAEAVQQAAQAAQALGQGNLPADLKAECERLQRTRLDWRRELAEFVKNAEPSRADWSRPARRHAWAPVLMPSRRVDGLGLLVIVRDTSGSIDGKTNAEFCAAVDSAIAETGARALVLDCDAAIAAEYRLEAGEECPRNYAGGGGTCFAAPFARVAELEESGERVAGLIYLTDLYGTHSPTVPSFPTLWISTTIPPPPVPFGRVVEMDLSR